MKAVIGADKKILEISDYIMVSSVLESTGNTCRVNLFFLVDQLHF